MADGVGILNVGEFAKPADTLIKKIAKATGAVFGPSHKVRDAKANAEAPIIEARGKAEAADDPLRPGGGEKQENIEEITDKATLLLEDSARPGK